MATKKILILKKKSREHFSDFDFINMDRNFPFFRVSSNTLPVVMSDDLVFALELDQVISFH